MNSPSSQSTTSLSLLCRLRDDPDDSRTWQEFVDRYGNMILRWGKQWGLQDADAHDVMQNVLLALSQQMKTFEYRVDGRFRSWLKTIAHRAWGHFLEQRRRSGTAAGDDTIRQLLESIEARDDFLLHLDRECERNLLEDAMAIVRQRVQNHTWEAFRRTALENQSGADVGQALEMSVLAVYRARSRVQAMIQEEIELLDHSE